MKKLIQPENSAEAGALQSLLQQHNIQSQIISFHDTAYDGLYQAQYGWGVLRVADEDYDEARKIIEDWKKSSPEELPWQNGDSETGSS